MEYQLKLQTPFAVLGVVCDEFMIAAIDYLPPRAGTLPPQNRLAAEAARQFQNYLKRGDFRFDLPLALAGTAHQRRAWAEIAKIPPGRARSYGDIARRIKSSPRAVGGACRQNRLPLIVPCHRVVAAAGIGGFMGDDGKSALTIKRWLLRHENVRIPDGRNPPINAEARKGRLRRA